MVRDSREKKMHAMRGSKDLYSRILGGIGKGSEGQTQLQDFMNKCASTSWSSCPWKLCELVSNIEEQLCIVFMYTGNLSIISTISQFESGTIENDVIHVHCKRSFLVAMVARNFDIIIFF
jgi:hypothetical protein